jgi:hypothetical protein
MCEAGNRRCGGVEMWRCGHVEKSRCEDVKLWRNRRCEVAEM